MTMKQNHDIHWYDFVPNIPFLPMRALSCGVVPRAKDPTRPRPTKDGKVPRQPPRHSSQQPVVPLNIGSAQAEWPKEHKPWVSEAMLILASLKHVASILREPVYVAGDDARNFFNQFRLATASLSSWTTMGYA